GEVGGRAQRAVRIRYAVVALVVGPEPAQDGVRLVHRRLTDLDPLEPAGERAVALEVALVVLVRRRTHAAEVARGERRFQDVRRVERAAVCGARPDHGVDLVDEEDGTWARHERRDDGLQTRLELAAELRAREQGAHVERVDLDVAQRGRDAAFVHVEREPLDDGRLPDARIADVDRVVLPPAAEDVDGALELARPSDQRVDAPRGRALDQVDGEGGERIARPPGATLLVLVLVLRLLGAAGRRHLRHLGDAVREI